VGTIDAMRSRRWIISVFVVLAACAAPAGSPSRPGPQPVAGPASTSALPQVDRIAVVVMENREYGQVIGGASAPYVNRLANRYALATRFFAVTHPSLPNYLALVGGSTFGITSDCTSCSVPGRSLVDQFERHAISWRAYIQAMPSACYTGGYSGRYAKKHNPFMYFDRIRDDPARCSHVVPFARLASDISHDTLPSFVWITPDLCHDGHDCRPIPPSPDPAPAHGARQERPAVPDVGRGNHRRGMLPARPRRSHRHRGGGGAPEAWGSFEDRLRLVLDPPDHRGPVGVAGDAARRMRVH
jgi:hypothetical protein